VDCAQSCKKQIWSAAHSTAKNGFDNVSHSGDLSHALHNPAARGFLES